jgi:hypothetical protein
MYTCVSRQYIHIAKEIMHYYFKNQTIGATLRKFQKYKTCLEKGWTKQSHEGEVPLVNWYHLRAIAETNFSNW